jgi:acetyl esterase/lipase
MRGSSARLRAARASRRCCPSIAWDPKTARQRLSMMRCLLGCASRQGCSARRIVIGGDSAGGGLALALLSHLCRSGTPPGGAFAFSPWTDLTLSGGSLKENAARDHYLPAERLSEARDMVLQGFDPADPRVSPLFADFPDAPSVLIHVAETEILRDDALRMARVLPGAEIRLAGDLPHVWPSSTPSCPRRARRSTKPPPLSAAAWRRRR